MPKNKSAYRKIFNPEQNITVNINSALGKKTLKKYLKYLNNSSFQRGGSASEAADVQSILALRERGVALGLDGLPEEGDIAALLEEGLSVDELKLKVTEWILDQLWEIGTGEGLPMPSLDDTKNYRRATSWRPAAEHATEIDAINELWNYINFQRCFALVPDFVERIEGIADAVREAGHELPPNEDLLNMVAEQVAGEKTQTGRVAKIEEEIGKIERLVDQSSVVASSSAAATKASSSSAAATKASSSSVSDEEQTKRDYWVSIVQQPGVAFDKDTWRNDFARRHPLRPKDMESLQQKASEIVESRKLTVPSPDIQIAAQMERLRRSASNAASPECVFCGGGPTDALLDVQGEYVTVKCPSTDAEESIFICHVCIGNSLNEEILELWDDDQTSSYLDEAIAILKDQEFDDVCDDEPVDVYIDIGEAQRRAYDDATDSQSAGGTWQGLTAILTGRGIIQKTLQDKGLVVARKEATALAHAEAAREAKRIATMDAEERSIYTAFVELQDSVLTLSAPCCGRAIAGDWSACQAVRCQGVGAAAGGCGSSFCGWCLDFWLGHARGEDSPFNNQGSGGTMTPAAAFSEMHRHTSGTNPDGSRYWSPCKFSEEYFKTAAARGERVDPYYATQGLALQFKKRAIGIRGIEKIKTYFKANPDKEEYRAQILKRLSDLISAGGGAPEWQKYIDTWIKRQVPEGDIVEMTDAEIDDMASQFFLAAGVPSTRVAEMIALLQVMVNDAQQYHQYQDITKGIIVSVAITAILEASGDQRKAEEIFQRGIQEHIQDFALPPDAAPPQPPAMAANRAAEVEAAIARYPLPAARMAAIERELRRDPAAPAARLAAIARGDPAAPAAPAAAVAAVAVDPGFDDSRLVQCHACRSLLPYERSFRIGVDPANPHGTRCIWCEGHGRQGGHADPLIDQRGRYGEEAFGQGQRSSRQVQGPDGSVYFRCNLCKIWKREERYSSNQMTRGRGRQCTLCLDELSEDDDL